MADDGIEHFDEMRNVERVKAGMKGGPFFEKPSLAPTKTFKEGWPQQTLEKLQATAIPQDKPMDAWVMRRNNAKL